VCGNFAVHGGSAITFAGDSSIVGGDVGISPGTSITGGYRIYDGELASTPSTVDSEQFVASVINAWKDNSAIRDDEAMQPIPNLEIGGSTFTPGTWRSAGPITTAAGTTVTFDGLNKTNSTFLIQAVTTMNVGASFKIVLINKARAENVVWAVGTTFTTGASVDFKGSIMAGTSVTFGANVKHDGSIFAQTTITLGAANEVLNGCVVALAAITFGTTNSITFQRDRFPDAFYFPLARDSDQMIIACLPLTDDVPLAHCNATDMAEQMLVLLNDCTSAALLPARRRASGIDIPQLADTVIVPTPTSDQAGGLVERRLALELQCTTTSPSLMTMIICCWLPSKPSFCGSPTNTRDRRKLQNDETVPASPCATSADVQAYLPLITAECTARYVAFAKQDEYTGCFAAADADAEDDLKCTAIVVTGGE
jgi:hypothetical protein